MANKQKMIKVKLTDDEYKSILLQRDINIMNLATAEFNLKQAKKSIELGLPLRQAKTQLEQQREELSKIKLNQKYYDKLARDKHREEPAKMEVPNRKD